MAQLPENMTVSINTHPHLTRKERLERKISEALAVEGAKATLRGETGCPEGDEPYIAAGILAGHVARHPDAP